MSRRSEGPAVPASWLQCVLAACVMLLAGASLAFAGLAAAARCEAVEDRSQP